MGKSIPKASRRRLAVIAPSPIVASEPLSCLKIAYPSEREADAARKGWRTGASYLCRLCAKWHTTRNPNFKLNLGK